MLSQEYNPKLLLSERTVRDNDKQAKRQVSMSRAGESSNFDRELGRLSDEQTDLFSWTTVPILMLDEHLRILKTTPLAKEILNICSADVGRPITDLGMRIRIDRVDPLVLSVIDHKPGKMHERQDGNALSQRLRVHPYRTSDRLIEGVVVLVDIEQLESARVAASSVWELVESLMESGPTPFVVVREDLRIELANRAFYTAYGGRPEEIQNRSLFTICGEQWNLPALRSAAEQILKDRSITLALKIEADSGGHEKRMWNVTLRSAGREFVLIALEDIAAQKLGRSIVEEQRRLQSSLEAGAAELNKTNQVLKAEISGRKQVETALLDSEAALLVSQEELRLLSASLLHAQDEERRRVSRELHDDLSQKVAKLQFDVEILQQRVPFSNVEDAKAGLRDVVAQAAALSNDLRRVAHQLHPATMDHLGLSVAMRSYAEEFARSTAIRVKFTGIQVPRHVPTEVASGLYRIMQEVLRNVGKHSSNAEVEIVLAKTSSGLALFIRDNGEGFDIESVRAKGGLGLISMQERVRLLNGKFSLETAPGEGILISIQCPLVWEN